MSGSKRTVCGVGVNDANYQVVKRNPDGSWNSCPFYAIWRGMLYRCYSEKELLKNPTYKGCTVCDEWLYFSNFKIWMEKQDWKGKDLDKDIITPLNRKYQPESCAFVSKKVNYFLITKKSNRGEYPLGVYYEISRGKFLARCSDGSGLTKNLGRFDCPDEAHEAWCIYKHKLACKYAEQQTDQRVAYALRQWFKPNGWYLKLEENK